MIRKSTLFVGSALAVLATASSAAAQQSLEARALEARVRGLEELLGVPARENDSRTLEQRVMDLESVVRAQRAAAPAPAPPAPEAAAAMAPVAQPSTERLDTLEMRVDRNQEADASRGVRLSTLEQQYADANWVFDYNRATIRTADNRFQLAFRGRFQFDSGVFFQDRDLPAFVTVGRDLHNGANFRRAQIGVEGRVYRDFNYEFVFDFGSSGTERAGQIYLLRTAYTGIPYFTFNIGAIQPKFTMDDSTSSADITFLERASIINTVLDPFGGSDSRRGLEVMYQRAGIFSGSDNLLISTAFTGERIANVKTDDEGSQLTGRVAYRFYSDEKSNYQIGIDGARILNKPNGLLGFSDRPETRVDGTQLVGFGTGALAPAVGAKSAWLYGIEGAMNYGPFYIGGEYYKYGLERTNSSLSDPSFGGWYLQASYFLNGEMRPYNLAAAAFTSPAVVTPFALDSGSWGTWELKARYSNTDFNAFANDPIAANRILGGEQNIISLGANWYLNRNLRWMFDFLIADVDRVNSSGQQVGQDFNGFVNRLQFTY